MTKHIVRKETVTEYRYYTLDLTEGYVKTLNDYIKSKLVDPDSFTDLTVEDVEALYNYDTWEREDEQIEIKSYYYDTDGSTWKEMLRDWVIDTISEDLYDVNYDVDDSYVDYEETTVEEW